MNNNKVSWPTRWNELPRDHPVRAIGMTALVATVSAVLVATSVLYLRPVQQANQSKSEQALLANIVSTLPGLEDVLLESGIDSLRTRWVHLDTGEISTQSPDIDYDVETAATDPNWSVEIPKADDVAGIVRRARHLPVHLLEKQGKLELVVLPVYGSGYQSTIRAWLALSGDVQTVISFSIVDQAETPGLGARIVEPAWLAQWAQRPLYNNEGDLTLRVSVGPAVSDNEIDGVSGATLTGNGINNLLQYWLSDQAFGPFLKNVEQGTLPL